MPKKLMQDIYQGYVKKENDKMADDMRQQPQALGAEMPDANVEQNAEIQPNA